MGGDGLPNSRSLSLAMAQSRETYVNAASLFGDVHRFTLLRAERAIEALIKSRSDMFEPGGADVALVAGDVEGKRDVLLGRQRWDQVVRLEDEADLLSTQERELLLG